jgi:acetyltransferase-like isoleucine patch superfamily enzyme
VGQRPRTPGWPSHVARRLVYVGLPFSAGFWRWWLVQLDALARDHWLAWDRIAFPPGTRVHPSVSFRSPERIFLGTDVRLQAGCVLWASPNGPITVHDGSGLGPGTMVFASNHQFEPNTPYRLQPWTEAPVVVGREVWVGAGCVLLPGVSIGDGAVVAAGTIVHRDVPAGCLVAGVPARVIRTPEAA